MTYNQSNPSAGCLLKKIIPKSNHLQYLPKFALMPNTYTQIFIHAVFAVKYRSAMIPMDKREEIYAYMGGIINSHRCQVIKIGGIGDHVHLLFRLSPTTDISKLIQSVKIGSTNFINEHHFTRCKFSWQEGYGAFSVSATHSDDVAKYVEGQMEHHLGVSFIDEYRRLLERNRVNYDEKYILGEPQ